MAVDAVPLEHRVMPNPRKTGESVEITDRAGNRRIAPRRSPVRVRLAPSKALEIPRIPEKVTPCPVTERLSQAAVK